MWNSKRYGWALVGAGLLLSATTARAAEPECNESAVTLTFKATATSMNKRARSSLDSVAKWAQEDDTRSIRVETYPGQGGNADRNRKLGDKRADAAKKYLLSKGIPAERIQTVAAGDETERPELAGARALAVTGCVAPKLVMTQMTPAPSDATTTPPPAEMPPPPAPAPALSTPPPAPPAKEVVVNVLPAPAPPAPQPPNPPASVVGMQASVAGGVTGFVGQGVRNFTDAGGAWDVRVVAGSILPVSFEGAYIGSAQRMKSLGLSDDAILLGNGAEGSLRINFTRTYFLQPYVFGGAGWINYRVSNTDIATGDLSRSDNVFEVPFGAGISGRVGRAFIADLRGTGRATFNDQLFDRAAATTNGSHNLHSWSATARLGYEF